MSPLKIGILYILTIPIFLAIDLLWLGVIAKDFYRKHLGSFFADQIHWAAAIIFYLLFIAGILIFAVLPALERQSWTTAILYGALFGLFTYGTYDLTNLATIRGWPLNLVLVDMAWGITLSSTVAMASFAVARRLQ